MKFLRSAIVLAFFAISFNVFSWGATGHRAIGLIAERYLTPAAKKKLQKILNGQSLARVSVWMDEVRSDSLYNHMSSWHWVTIETEKTYEESPKNQKGDVVMTLERVIQELKSKKITSKQEEELVKILVHLIGDIHQPLHVGCCDDSGGNRVKVKWHGRETDLHSVWDSDIINETKLSYSELADGVGKPTKERIQQLQKSTVRQWANESMAMRKQVYAIGDGNLGYKYSYKNLPDVERRILEAGIRLAGILNSIYK